MDGAVGLPVVGQQSVLQDEPALLVALDIVGPLVEPALRLGRLHRLLLLLLSHGEATVCNTRPGQVNTM